jgi:DNA-directed RNA polymerase specialized sigma24 family protein
MSAVIAEFKREDLFREISDAYHRWPELDRSIFAQAHYHGQSMESISSSLKLDVKKVRAILKQRDREMLISLRDFRRSGIKTPTVLPAKDNCQAAQSLNPD